MTTLLVTLLMSVALIVSNCDAILNPAEEELQIYRTRNLALHRILARDCQQTANANRRQLGDQDNVMANLEVAKGAHSILLSRLIECRKAQGEQSTALMPPATQSTASTITSAQTTQSTSSTTTSAPSKPIECLSTTSYTESWRMDHNGSNIVPVSPPFLYNGYACDLQMTITDWFRFAGEAGTRMLNTCPKYQSCGARWPLWTDEPMPTVVGVRSKIIVYGSSETNCRRKTYTVEVMRCSWDTDHDLIYKQITNSGAGCQTAFCGMM